MRLWFDGQCFQSASAIRGIGRYAEELICALASHPEKPQLHISYNGAWPDEAEIARDRLSPYIPLEQQHVWFGHEDGSEVAVGQTSHRRLSEIALAHHVLSLSPDVAISLSPFEGDVVALTPFLPPKDFPVATAAIFYDAIPLRLPDLYLFTNELRQAYDRRLAALAEFDQLLTISEYSKREAEALVCGPSVANISTGLNRSYRKALEVDLNDRVRTAVSGDGVTLLYVGGLDRRKNLLRLVRAIGVRYQAGRQNINLLIVGARQSEELDQIRVEWASQGLPEAQLNTFGFATEAELLALYTVADIVIQPSLLEGFGLTALEALASGTPVLASRAGALPEIVEDPECLFDPTSETSIADCLKTAVGKLDALNAKSEDYKIRARSFSWNETADRAMKAFSHLSANGVTLDAARRYSTQKVRALDYDPAAAASVLASAETLSTPPAQRRLFVDITSTARTAHASGIQRVVKNIIRSLPALMPAYEGVELEFIGTDDRFGFFPVSPTATVDDWDQRRDERISLGRGDTILMLDSSWEFSDVHTPVLKMIRLRGAEVISAIYDLVPARMPAFCAEGMPAMFTNWLSSALRFSDGVVCISQAVANEVHHYLEGVDFPRSLKVGHWPLGTEFRQSLKPVDVENPLFLSVGTLEPRKGHRFILDAFDELWAEGLDVDLCLVGRKGWGIDPFVTRVENHPELGRRLTWRSSMDDAELSTKYSEATALISASFSEGFGLPLIEAGHLGKPILASDLPVFREVAAGFDAEFFPVGDSSALADLIRKRSALSPVHTRTPGRGQEPVSWLDSAEKLLEVTLGDGFQKRYVPQKDASDTRFSRAITHQSSIELIQSPDIMASAKAIRIMVRIRNDSGSVWQSSDNIDDNNRQQMHLAAMLANTSGQWLDDMPILVDFPFPLESGAEAILSLDVPLERIRQGASAVYLAPMQPGVGLAASPIEVNLHTTLMPTSRVDVTN